MYQWYSRWDWSGWRPERRRRCRVRRRWRLRTANTSNRADCTERPPPPPPPPRPRPDSRCWARRDDGAACRSAAAWRCCCCRWDGPSFRSCCAGCAKWSWPTARCTCRTRRRPAAGRGSPRRRCPGLCSSALWCTPPPNVCTNELISIGIQILLN